MGLPALTPQQAAAMQQGLREMAQMRRKAYQHHSSTVTVQVSLKKMNAGCIKTVTRSGAAEACDAAVPHYDETTALVENLFLSVFLCLCLCPTETCPALRCPVPPCPALPVPCPAILVPCPAAPFIFALPRCAPFWPCPILAPGICSSHCNDDCIPSRSVECHLSTILSRCFGHNATQRKPNCAQV